MASGMEYDALNIGTLVPGGEVEGTELRAGEVGFLHGAIKSVDDARVGDTITLARAAHPDGPLPGYAEPVPMVNCGLEPDP